MGAWGEGPFDNDDAADFVGDLTDGAAADAPDALAAVLDHVVGEGYIEAPEMSRGLAAAAVIALSADLTLPEPASMPAAWRTDLPAPAPGPALVAAAIAVLDRAFDATDNEWFELWNDSDLLEQARMTLAPYIAALAAAGSE